MDKKTSSLIKGYLGKSKEKLKVATRLFKTGNYEDSVSRAYYSVFHAAQAILLSGGLTANTHQGLINLFGLHFIKTGKLNKKFGRFLAELKDDRERCDYEIYSTIGKEEALQALKEAKEFLQGIQKYLSRIR